MTDKDKIIDLGYRPTNLTLISDEKIIGDFCNTCDYMLEGCHEHEQQKSCQSYKEALRQRKQAAQRQLDHCKRGGLQMSYRLTDKEIKAHGYGWMQNYDYEIKELLQAQVDKVLAKLSLDESKR